MRFCLIHMPVNTPESTACKTPPHSMEAGQSVLGGLLLDNEALDRVGDVIGLALRRFIGRMARKYAAGRESRTERLPDQEKRNPDKPQIGFV